ncbi:unnamed protein product [Acanthosepion pharaonis]|uniref:Uncharacterized protein n=1 Tax=Acanthosepion pharaonis TaxID=158019 RepID=A0A812EFD9_ACAPH|nr:unnamed protein product [Sepia pharaonis]
MTTVNIINVYSIHDFAIFFFSVSSLQTPFFLHSLISVFLLYPTLLSFLSLSLSLSPHFFNSVFFFSSSLFSLSFSLSPFPLLLLCSLFLFPPFFQSSHLPFYFSFATLSLFPVSSVYFPSTSSFLHHPLIVLLSFFGSLSLPFFLSLSLQSHVFVPSPRSPFFDAFPFFLSLPIFFFLSLFLLQAFFLFCFSSSLPPIFLVLLFLFILPIFLFITLNYGYSIPIALFLLICPFLSFSLSLSLSLPCFLCFFLSSASTFSPLSFSSPSLFLLFSVCLVFRTSLSLNPFLTFLPNRAIF